MSGAGRGGYGGAADTGEGLVLGRSGISGTGWANSGGVDAAGGIGLRIIGDTIYGSGGTGGYWRMTPVQNDIVTDKLPAMAGERGCALLTFLP